jgi:hypothetical protein
MSSMTSRSLCTILRLPLEYQREEAGGNRLEAREIWVGGAGCLTWYTMVNIVEIRRVEVI